MTLKPPKGLLFDFGDTLCVDPGFDPVAGTRALLDVASVRGDATAEEIQTEADRLLADLKRRVEESSIELANAGFSRLLYPRFGVEFDRPDDELEWIFWQGSYGDGWDLAPGIGEVLASARERGIPMGVVSNCSAMSATIENVLRTAGILDEFRFVMSSSEYVYRKPHPEIYRTAAAKLGVPAESIWFFGDRVERDVVGALAAGMTAVWYAPHGREPDGAAPHLTLRTWSDLTELWRGLE